MEKVNPITYTDPDTGDTVVLEFNRQTVIFTNRQGFKLSEFADNVEEMLPILWYGAHRMHHKLFSREKTDRILEMTGGLTTAQAERLTMLYSEPRNAMFRENDDDGENPTKVKLSI